MYSLLIVRHAKSSWDFGVEDFDRPLNNRGKSDAPEMAERLKKRGVNLDVMISSPAKRALSTATLFSKVFDDLEIFTIPSLYEASAKTFEKVITEQDDRYKQISLFSHNPGITDFINSLTNVRVDDLPTCAVFAVKADITSWKEFAAAKKEFWFYDFPKA